MFKSNFLKFILIISKLKYISIIFLSVGGLLKLQYLVIGWFTGGVSLTIGVLFYQYIV